MYSASGLEQMNSDDKKAPSVLCAGVRLSLANVGAILFCRFTSLQISIGELSKKKIKVFDIDRLLVRNLWAPISTSGQLVKSDWA
jgi:hypothetical protein